MTHVVLLSCCFRADERPSPRRSAASSPGEEGLRRWVWNVAGYSRERIRLPRTPPAQRYIMNEKSIYYVFFNNNNTKKYHFYLTYYMGEILYTIMLPKLRK